MKSPAASFASVPVRRIVKQRGLTLIETCVVLAIAVVLASTAAPGFSDMLDARRLDRAATGLASDIQFLRTESVARNQPLRLSRYAMTGGSCYVIHTGDAAQCSCRVSGPAQCSGGAQELRTVTLADDGSVSLNGTTNSVLFDPLHGTVSPTATLRVVGSRNLAGREVHHVINVMGRVRSCSPLGAMSGYRVC